MTFNILWPAMRWPSDREIEVSSVGEHNAHFFERYDDVPDEQWAGCDAVVSVNDIPEEFRSKMTKCRIFMTPKVGFDNIDVRAWAEIGVPVCNVPDYGTQEVADHAIALMMSLMKGITFHTRELKKDPRGLWRPALNPYGKRLSVSVCGIVGLGRIGTAAALRARGTAPARRARAARRQDGRGDGGGAADSRRAAGVARGGLKLKFAFVAVV